MIQWFRCDEDTLLYRTHSQPAFPSRPSGSIKLLRNHQESHLHSMKIIFQFDAPGVLATWGDYGGGHVSIIIVDIIWDPLQKYQILLNNFKYKDNKGDADTYKIKQIL